MHCTTLMPLFSSIILLGGLAAAIPVGNAVEKCLSQTICVDAINPCGIRYGGCYDVCDASAKPVAPPCPSTAKPPVPTTTAHVITKVTTLNPKPTTTTKKTSTKKPHPTTTKKPTTSVTAKPTSTCNTQVSVCWDGINECGKTYGGCFPDCKPWPTFTPPPCPTTKATATVITRVTTLPILTVHD